MTLAILGGTGFIGQAVAQRALHRGLRPIAIARGEHPVTLPDGVLFEPMDRMNRAGLLEIFRRHQVDTLVDIFALGMLNTSAAMEAMAEVGGRYVLLSSVDVYANYGGLLRRETPAPQLAPAREDDPLRNFRFPYRGNPHRPKGVTAELFEDYDKIVLEEAARAEPRFKTSIVRAPMIFGPGDKQHRFAWAINAVRSGETIRVDSRAANWPNSYGFVADVAEAMLTVALDPRGAGRTYNVGQPFVRTPVEWLRRFAEVMNRTIDIEIVPPEQKGLLHERADATDLLYPLTLDTTRIRAELCYTEPTSEEDALRATIAAER